MNVTIARENPSISETGSISTPKIALVKKRGQAEARASTDSIFREHSWVWCLNILVDMVALELALRLGLLIPLNFVSWWTLPFTVDQTWDLALGILLIPCGYWLLHLYPGYGLTAVERFRRRVRATSAIFPMLMGWEYLVRGALSVGVFATTYLFALILPPLFQTVVRRALIRLNLWGTPVLILGAAKTGRMLVSTLKRDKILGLRPVALLDDDHRKWGSEVEGVPVLGGTKLAYDFAGRVRYAMIAMPGAERNLIIDLVRNLPFPHILLIPNLFGLQSLWVDARDMSGVLSLEMKKNLLLKRNWVIKRLFDYVLGIPLFLASFPIITIFAAWIKLVSPGPAFYAQEREGFEGKKIKVWKLRTMFTDADQLLHCHLNENPAAKEEWDRFFKLKNDPRILPWVGTVLRKTSLDELPQLWNILCGEMSLVGPRPFPYYHLEKFSKEFCSIRRSVLPGLTGLWQVSARSDGDLKVQESLDTYYIRNWSIWMDILLLGQTILTVLSGKGAY